MVDKAEAFMSSPEAKDAIEEDGFVAGKWGRAIGFVKGFLSSYQGVFLGGGSFFKITHTHSCQ